MQEKVYPLDGVENIVKESDIVVACNINFARPLLRVAHENNKLIATDVHVIKDVDDDYNKEFMKYADILFMSNENIKGMERDFIEKLIKKYDNEIIVVGMGRDGVLLYVKNDGNFVNYPAVKTREIVSTVGAGDAMFSAFIHFYAKDKNPYTAVQNAIVFASYKIGERGGASGFHSMDFYTKD